MGYFVLQSEQLLPLAQEETQVELLIAFSCELPEVATKADQPEQEKGEIGEDNADEEEPLRAFIQLV